jgi:hypothetical protein
MKRLLLLLAAVPLFCGCVHLNRPEAEKVVKATKNNEVVADNLAKKPATVPHAKIIKEQNKTILFALDLPPEKEAEIKPDVDPVLLDKDPEKAADVAAENAAEDRKEIEKSREWGILGFLKSATFWGAAGTVGLFILRMLLAQTGWGAPFAGMIDSVAHKIPVVGPALKKGQSAIATAESSMAGRFGLQMLDKALGDQYTDKIRELTGGKCSTAEELFKYVAKGHAIDSSKIHHSDVETFVDDMRTKMETAGGIPDSVKKIFGALQS